MGSIDLSLTRALGQRILAEQHLDGVVSHVDIECSGFAGSEWTGADWDYPVTVHYVDPHGGGHKVEKTYLDLPSIIKELEDIDDEKFD